MRCCCPSSACFTCSSSRRTATGGGLSCCWGWQPLYPRCSCLPLLTDWNLQNPGEILHSIALTPPQLLAQFLRYLANGVVFPAPWVGELLVVLLPLALLVATVLRLRARRPVGARWLLAFVSVTLLLLIIGHANEALRIVSERRMRYLIALWPLLALLAGCGLRQLGRRASSPGSGPAGNLADPWGDPRPDYQPSL